jgi:hypothetical protein
MLLDRMNDCDIEPWLSMFVNHRRARSMGLGEMAGR